jgi:hypothetical protein
MLRPKILPKRKSLLLEPVLKGGDGTGVGDEFTKLVDRPVHYSWSAFAIFLLLIAVAFVTAGRALTPV